MEANGRISGSLRGGPVERRKGARVVALFQIESANAVRCERVAGRQRRGDCELQRRGVSRAAFGQGDAEAGPELRIPRLLSDGARERGSLLRNLPRYGHPRLKGVDPPLEV